MRRSSRNLVLLISLAVIIGSVYFYLSYRRDAIIESQRSDSNLLFQNPTETDLLIYLNKDSFELPASSVVYYAVNSKNISKSKIHIKSIDSKTGKIITDTDCQLSEDVMDYFINPSLTNYVRWSLSFLVVQQVNEVSYRPIGDKTAILQGAYSNDTTSSSALIIDCKDCRDPIARVVERSLKPNKSDKGIVHYNYVLSRADYNSNIANNNEMKDFQQIFRTDVWEGYFSPEMKMVSAKTETLQE